ncbi:hypothetical protein [Paenibacillus whitsoniae]|uniref:Uncharacterized protein n=1 Tax=Paenibacillus whitsoniae TaxID=2496558 RepID=A0A430JHK2_9BACL|nr:hypothetical protein [Paenibacillus whitsoniae]RTE10524.1 hypothetical protein EJQ19_06630 [Paenibacillus whitsoniae]
MEKNVDIDMIQIQEKHQYTVWTRVHAQHAKGLVETMKARLIQDNGLSDESNLIFMLYAFKRDNVLMLAADQQN